MPTTRRTKDQKIVPRAPDLNFGNPRGIVDFVELKLRDIRASRDRLERQWYLNIAYFLGHQYLQWDAHSRGLYLPHAPKHRVRLVINRLLPIVRRIVASTMRGKPQWVVSPATQETDDRITSLLATDYLKYQWKNLDMESKLIDLVKWRACTGNVFVRTFWNASRGDRIVFDVEDLAGAVPRDLADREAKKQEAIEMLQGLGLVGPDDSPERMGVNLGDVDVEIVSPFNVFPDPSVDKFEDVEWVIDCRERSHKYVEDTYGLKRSDYMENEDASNMNFTHKEKLRNMDGAAFGGGLAGTSSGQMKDAVEVRTIYVKPTRAEPDGWWAVLVGDHVVRKQRNQAGFPTFPYHHIQEVPVPGRLWGTCVLEQTIPIQVAYNRARSQIVEHCNTVTRPPWLIPKGSGINDTAFTGEPGEKIHYTFPMKPELAPPAALPNANHENVEGLIRDVEDVSSQHEAQKGDAPGRVESGVGLASLMEQDDSMLAPASAMTATVLSHVGTHLLQIASVMVDEERLVKIVGENHAVDVQHFKGNDLVGQNSGKSGVNYFDVRVEMGANIPLSSASRRELAMSLAQFGILDPQKKEDKEKILELLELNRDPATMSPGQMDMANARLESASLTTGVPVDPKPFDDHEIHIHTHREFQKSAEYRRLLDDTGGVDGEVHQLFENHIAAHKTAIEELMAPPSPAMPPEGPEMLGTPGGMPPGMDGGMGPPGMGPPGMPPGMPPGIPPEMLMGPPPMGPPGMGPPGMPPGMPPMGPEGGPPVPGPQDIEAMMRMLETVNNEAGGPQGI